VRACFRFTHLHTQLAFPVDSCVARLLFGGVRVLLTFLHMSEKCARCHIGENRDSRAIQFVKAIDWLSRIKPSPLKGKCTSLIGATPGMGGTFKSQIAFLPVLNFLEMPFLQRPIVTVGGVVEAWGVGRCGVAALRRCGVVALWRCGVAALRRCGVAALRRCGKVATW
jgi:hypothetical protein